MVWLINRTLSLRVAKNLHRPVTCTGTSLGGDDQDSAGSVGVHQDTGQGALAPCEVDEVAPGAGFKEPQLGRELSRKKSALAITPACLALSGGGALPQGQPSENEKFTRYFFRLRPGTTLEASLARSVNS